MISTFTYRLILRISFLWFITGFLSLTVQAQIQSTFISVQDSLDRLNFHESDTLGNLDTLLRTPGHYATWTQEELRSTPADVTVITRREIDQSPYRNLLDLIEIYVPGTTWLNSSSGPVLSMRGVTGPQNTAFQIWVDGVNLTSDTHFGAFTELENWNLDDVKQIEVIRGPVSSVFGAGSTGGVIHIRTQQAKVRDSYTQINTQFYSQYNSAGLSLIHKVGDEDLSFFGYLSLVSTSGADTKAYGISLFSNPTNALAEFGVIGRDFDPGTFLADPATTYLADYNDEPQIKAALEFKIKKNWVLRARYNQTGTTSQGIGITQSRPTLTYRLDSVTTDQNGFPVYFNTEVLGDYEDQAAYRNRQLSLSLQRDFTLSDKLSISSLASFNTLDFEARRLDFFNYSVTTSVEDRQVFIDRDNAFYKRRNFSENEYSLRLITRYNDQNKIQAALGLEYTYQDIQSGWGDPGDAFLTGTSSDQLFIISNDQSPLFQLRENLDLSDSLNFYQIGETGWDASRFSGFGELNFRLSPIFHFLANVRGDYHSLGNFLLSNRFAWIAQWKNTHTLKLIAQSGQRWDVGEHLFLMNELGLDAEEERNGTIELQYRNDRPSGLSYNASVYLQQRDILIWVDSLRQNALEGELEYLGVELGLRYQKDAWDFGAMYSYVGQNDPEESLEENIPLLFSDTIRVFRKFFSNAPQQSLKLWVNYRFLRNRINLHADLQGFWDYGITADEWDENVQNVQDGQESASLFEQSSFDSFSQSLEDENIYQSHFRLNLGMQINISPALRLEVYVQNVIPELSKRYAHNSGKQFTRFDFDAFEQVMPDFDPVRILNTELLSYIEEPRIVGAKIKVRL